MRLGAISLLVLLVAPLGAAAQSAYVGASVFGDIVRRSGTTSVVGGEASGSGEAIGFSIRAGTPLGDRWGVELEFARPSEIEEDTASVLPLSFTNVSLPQIDPILRTSLLAPLTLRAEVRNTTLSAGAWIRQDFTARTSLVYVAGLGFYRSEREVESSFDPRILAGAVLPILPYDFETVLYGVKPFVGVEARLGLGEHAQLVPAVRLHGIDDGWLLRPGIGVNWMF